MNAAIAVDIGKPNNTLYIQNLNEKAKPSEVVRILRSKLDKYGEILDIIVKQRVKLRGQAFVIFDNEGSAVRALHATQGKYMFEKPMVVKFAKSKSDLISKRDGTYKEELLKRSTNKPTKLTKKEEISKQIEDNPEGIDYIPVGSEFIIPNQILFVENIDESVTNELLNEKFKQFGGFVEVRVIPGRSDICFVEFEDEYLSAEAKNSLDQTDFNGSLMKITFAKK